MGDKPAVIYVVDDDVGCRTAFGRLLRSVGYKPRLYAAGEEVIGDASADEMPECVLLDLVMPGGMCGLELLERLAAVGRRYPTIVLTACGEPEKAFRAGKLGVREFLRKPVSDTELLGKIKDVVAGSRSKELPRDARRLRAQRLVLTLSPRERQALALLKDNRKRKQVAVEMGIGASTVKYYCDNIFKKLGVHTVRDALEIWDAVRSDT